MPSALPNVLTAGRIVLIPFLVWALAVNTSTGDAIAAVIFAVASITDFVDGYLARRENAISSFGKLMDPIADKLLVICTLLVLCINNRLGWWVAAVIIIREVAVTMTRMRVRRAGGEVIAAAQLGKLKTVVQLWALLFVIIFNPTPLWVDLVVDAAVILTIVSGVDFYVKARRGMSAAAAPAPAPPAA